MKSKKKKKFEKVKRDENIIKKNLIENVFIAMNVFECGLNWQNKN